MMGEVDLSGCFRLEFDWFPRFVRFLQVFVFSVQLESFFYALRSKYYEANYILRGCSRIDKSSILSSLERSVHFL